MKDNERKRGKEKKKRKKGEGKKRIDEKGRSLCGD